jgi:hypothetical protein
MREAMKSFGQIVDLLANQQRLLRNICKTELQPLVFQNNSQINIFFTLATTLLLPCMHALRKHDCKRYPYSVIIINQLCTLRLGYSNYFDVSATRFGTAL